MGRERRPACPPAPIPAAAPACGTAEMRCRDRSTDAGERSRSPQAQDRAPPSDNAAADIAGAPSCSRTCPARTDDRRPDHGSPAWRPSPARPSLDTCAWDHGPTRRIGGGFGALFDAGPGGMCRTPSAWEALQRAPASPTRRRPIRTAGTRDRASIAADTACPCGSGMPLSQTRSPGRPRRGRAHPRHEDAIRIPAIRCRSPAPARAPPGPRRRVGAAQRAWRPAPA